MKLIFKVIIIFFVSFNTIAREKGETEITTEDGIEVFQNDKFYLLKKNVKIHSDNFNLSADNVKINFDKSLYDIIEINAEGNVFFDSLVYDIKGKGEDLKFEVKIEKLIIKGKDSELFSKNIQMFSDGYIELNNLGGSFSLQGINSKLVNDTILIKANKINGNFSEINNENEITLLTVSDDNISYVKNIDTEMYAKKINFNNTTSIIELFENVTIVRNEEKISGDYGTLDTINNSYKIGSNNQKKVKVIIKNDE